MNQCYKDGSEIHIGDSVSFNRQKGKIVFVVDRDEYFTSFPESVWTKSQFPSGFMIQFTNGALLFQSSCDELLEKDKEGDQKPKE